VKVLITGGAGFIGSHLTDRLVSAGARVRILDNLEPQVHGGGAGSKHDDRPCDPPEYLNPAAELFIGDVRDKEAVLEALDSVDAVFHLAARVGVGQSMYEMVDYTAANAVGTAVLLEALVDRPVKRLIVASSMSIYGEGRCAGVDHIPRRAAPSGPDAGR
jgi:dTDP-L-rhamnose 4-epimerase